VPALVIAIGNCLRGDDGVAHRVADLLHGVSLLRVHQLAPEIAAEMQHADPVIFLDADPDTEAPSLERIEEPAETTGPLSHSMTPQTLVAIATRLYGFRGEAWLCRLCARDFNPSTELSPEAAAQLDTAAQLVRQLLETRCTSPR
jgi:hydrogenase maturation protease